MTTRTKRIGLVTTALCLVGMLVLGADEVRLWWATRNPGDEIARLVTLTGISRGQTVAEIGAGPGQFAKAVARQVGPEGRMLATELGASRLSTLRQATAGSTVQVAEGHRTGTSLPERCCDVVYMRHVYHHFGDPGAMARDLRRAVGDGGRVAVIDFESRFGILSLLEPAGRGGHGVAMGDVIREMTDAGFVVDREIPGWTSRTFLLLFRIAEPRKIAE